MKTATIIGYWPKDWYEQCWIESHNNVRGHSLPKEIWMSVDEARQAFGHDFVEVEVTIRELTP